METEQRWDKGKKINVHFPQRQDYVVSMARCRKIKAPGSFAINKFFNQCLELELVRSEGSWELFLYIYADLHLLC